MLKIGILPAAGLATRMNGIPKFLLPISHNGTSLLGYHVELISPCCENIFVPTRPEWGRIVDEEFPSVAALRMQTTSLAATVFSVCGEIRSEGGFDWAIVGLPDTYFVGNQNFYQILAGELDSESGKSPDPILWVYVFKTESSQRGSVGSIRLGPDGTVNDYADKDPERDFGAHWGLLAFNQAASELIDSTWETIGNLIPEVLAVGRVRVLASESGLIDCGTFEGYRTAINMISHAGNNKLSG